MEFFSTLIAYIVFLIIGRSKDFISNIYLKFIGISYFFVGIYDLLHALSFEHIAIFPGFGGDLPIQLWMIARYLESTSYLIAALLMIKYTNDGQKNSRYIDNSDFSKRLFFIYAIITATILTSVLYFKNFPSCYYEGSRLTLFKIISEYIICFILISSLLLLYKIKDKFETKVFYYIKLSLIFTCLVDVPFLLFSHFDKFPSVVGHFFKAISFYFLYLAIVESGFDKSLISTEYVLKEEALERETAFLTSEQNFVFSLLGMEKKTPELREKYKEIGARYKSLVQNFSGIMFQLDEKFLPIHIEGNIEDLTGYSKKDFISGSVNWVNIIVSEDLPIKYKMMEHMMSDFEVSEEMEYRIHGKDGKIKWVREFIQHIPNSSGKEVKYQNWIYDITKRKIIEENIEKNDEIRKKEIHHRIKNNLQVISSLLDLQSEKFKGKENIQDSEVLQAFMESQDRVISMALIHEELYKGRQHDTLNFSSYLEKLVENLFQTYRLESNQISLNMDLDENLFLDMDTAVPLGIIVNELVSNSLKHAFKGRDRGEIRIILHTEENENDSTSFILVVSDNGVGIPENLELEDLDSLGMQLVTTLIDQLDGELELKRINGTEFTMKFKVTEKKMNKLLPFLKNRKHIG